MPRPDVWDPMLLPLHHVIVCVGGTCRKRPSLSRVLLLGTNTC